MKVLHVYRTYFPDTQGGAEEVVRQICRNTKPLGVESRVFYPSSTPDPRVLETEEGQVIRVKKHFEIASCGFCLTGLAEFKEQVLWADIVHYHFPWPFGDLMHLLTSVNKPSVVTYHSDVVRQKALDRIYQPIRSSFFRSVHKVIATSQNYANSSELLRQMPDKLEIIPLGLDESTLPKVEDTFVTEVEAKFGRNFMLFIGVMRYYKGLHFLLDALKGQKFQAVLVGSGPEEKNLRKQANDLNLSNVSFPGYVCDRTKIALLKLSRAFVLPSHLRSEAFGVSLLEAASMGKPMITTELGTGTSFVNRHEQTGLVVPPEDTQALSESMNRLDKDPCLADKYGQRARARFEEKFTGESMAKAYINVYQEILEAS